MINSEVVVKACDIRLKALEEMIYDKHIDVNRASNNHMRVMYKNQLLQLQEERLKLDQAISFIRML